MPLRLVSTDNGAALAIRDHLLPLIRQRGSIRVQCGPLRLVTWQTGAWTFNHWTPFNEACVEMAASPGYRHALEGQYMRPTLGYGMDIWLEHKLLNVLWGDGGPFLVLSFARGPWEEQVMAL